MIKVFPLFESRDGKNAIPADIHPFSALAIIFLQVQVHLSGTEPTLPDGGLPV